MDFAYPTLQQPPKTLYHYTSLSALVSIVQSKSIWASNIRFLNDRTESTWLQDHVLSILRSKEHLDGKQIEQIIAKIEGRPPQSCFVASFTENSDDLSQWRAYCPPRRGVCIGFSSKCLGEQWVTNPKSKEEPFFFGTTLQKVRYYGTSHEAGLRDTIDVLLGLREPPPRNPEVFFDFFPEMFPAMIETMARVTGRADVNLTDTIPVWLSMLAPLFKHTAFEAEAEWRKIIKKDYRLMPGQKFRQGESSLIPYVEVMLDAKYDQGTRVSQDTYFIDEIVIGPTPVPELTTEAVQALFASEKQNVSVRVSHIPYRNW